jgi:TrmH family RNA methyltransferase
VPTFDADSIWNWFTRSPVLTLTGRTAILLGSEAHGISPRWQQAAAAGEIAFATVSLPMRGAADSLNLSVTAAVLAYEALRQEGTTA